MVLIPVADGVATAAGALDELELPEPLEPDDPAELLLLPLLPHAASPTTAAARTGVTHHRLRIVFLSYRYGIYETPYTHGLRGASPVGSRPIQIVFRYDAPAQPGQ
jgi:hypothetical protein